MDNIESIVTIAVAVSSAVGYAAGYYQYWKEKQERNKCHENIAHQTAACTGAIIKSAVDTMVEDFKIDKATAEQRFMARCQTQGITLIRMDRTTGKQTRL